jgi:hypothetical protein
MAVTPRFLNISLNSKNTVLLLPCIYTPFLNKFSDCLYEEQTPCTNPYSTSLKNSVTDFGYSFLLFSDKTSIIVAHWSSYSLQSQNICSSVCSRSPYPHSAVDTKLNLLSSFVVYIHNDMYRNASAKPFILVVWALQFILEVIDVRFVT